MADRVSRSEWFAARKRYKKHSAPVKHFLSTLFSFQPAQITERTRKIKKTIAESSNCTNVSPTRSGVSLIRSKVLRYAGQNARYAAHGSPTRSDVSPSATKVLLNRSNESPTRSRVLQSSKRNLSPKSAILHQSKPTLPLPNLQSPKFFC